MQRGSFVSSDIHDVLRHIEYDRIFVKRALTLEAQGKVLSSLISPIKDRIVIFRSTDWTKMLACHNGSDSEHETQRLIDRYELWDVSRFDLVAMPVMGESGGHFSGAMWLPLIDKIVHGDTSPDCGHLARTKQYFKPFAERARDTMQLSNGTMEVVLASKVEEQLDGSNVCAFTSSKILGLALAKLLQLYEAEATEDAFSGEEDEYARSLALAQARQQALFDYLITVELKAASYQRLRQQSNADIAELASDYAKHRNRKLKLSASSSTKAAKPAGPSSDAEEVPFLLPLSLTPSPLPFLSPFPPPHPGLPPLPATSLPQPHPSPQRPFVAPHRASCQTMKAVRWICRATRTRARTRRIRKQYQK